MLRLLTDENLHGGIARGIRAAQLEVDVVRVQEVGLAAAGDAAILQWAADQDRIVVSKDRKTMIRFAKNRVNSELPMPGLFVLRNTAKMRQIIDDLLLAVNCLSNDECKDGVVFFPL